MKQADTTLLNVQKAALFLGVSSATIRQWAQTKKLKGLKIGSRGDWRFTKQELEKMINSGDILLEERTIQKQLRDSEERYKNFLQLSSEGIWRFEVEEPIPINLPIKKQIKLMYKYGYLAECNDALAMMYGFSKASDIIGARLGDFLIENDPQNITYLTAFIQSHYNLRNTESTEKDKDGNICYFVNNLIGVVEDSLLKRAWGTQRDNTMQRRNEEALKLSEERFRLAIKGSNDGVWDYDLLTGKIYWNTRLYEMLGLSKKTYQPDFETFSKLFHPDDWKRVNQLFRQHLANPKIKFQTEYRLKHADGYYISTIAKGEAVRDSSGKPIRIVGVNVDISGQRESQQALEEARTYYKRLFDSNIIGIVIAGCKGKDLGKFIDANDFFLDSFGYTRKDLQNGKVRWDEITPQEFRYLDEKALKELNDRQECKPYEKEYINSKGERVPIYLGISAIPNTNYCIAYILDISKRKQLEKLKDETLNLLELVLENAPTGIFRTDQNGNCVYINKRWSEFAELTLKEAYGTGWIKALHPEDKDRVIKEWYQAAEQKKEFESEYRFLTKTGKITWLHGNAIAIKDERDIINGYLGTISDITRLKNLERQKDDFLGIASHELKTPVTSLKAFAQVLQRTFIKEGDENSANLLSKMDAQIDRLTALINDLLDVTKIESGKILFHEGYFNFDGLVEDTVEQIQRTTDKHRLIIQGQTKQKVYGDKERICQVIINFLTNAIKYSPQSDKIMIKLSSKKNTVSLSVQDFGVGIPPENLSHVFERFYRVSGSTHTTVPGMGLGLYISAQIIQRQHGKIWAKSEKNKGSTFSFKLPVKHTK